MFVSWFNRCFCDCLCEQENILYDQMTKVLSATAPGPEAVEAEKKFKSYILEYRDRASKNAAKVQKEVSETKCAAVLCVKTLDKWK